MEGRKRKGKRMKDQVEVCRSEAKMYCRQTKLMLKSGGQRPKGRTLGVKKLKETYVAQSFSTAFVEFCLFLFS